MMTQHQVQYGTQTIPYEMLFAVRKTLAIHVHPDLRVTVKAPEGSAESVIHQKVHQRAGWILKQQRQFESIT